MKKEKGWELDYLEDIFELQNVLENEPGKLLEYCNQNRLCAVHPNQRKLVIVRRYHFSMDDDLIELFAGEPYGDEGHWGIGLIDLDKKAVLSLSEPLPDNLTYKHVEFQGDSVLIVSEEKQFLTNWNELERKFPFLSSFTEKEIVEIYDSLKNDFVTKEKVVRKKPKAAKVETGFIGTLKVNKSKTSFSGRGKWRNKTVKLEFLVDNNGEIERGLITAKELWSAQADWDARVKMFAAKELLELKNEDWLGEDEKKLNLTQFKRRMSLESITFYDEGSFEFFFDDGDLFWGHLIQVSGNIDDGLTQAMFQG